MNLIINADDFGLSQSINDAILELSALGSITSTSVMVNMPHACEVRNLIEQSRVGIGLHINLTQGRPVSDPKSIPSLVDPSGSFLSKDELVRRFRTGKIPQNHLDAEIQAQFEALFSIAGDRLDHFDSHQGAFRFGPVKRAVRKLVDRNRKRYGMRVYSKIYLIKNSCEYATVVPTILNIHRFGFKRVVVEYVFRYKARKQKRFFACPDGMLFTPGHDTCDVLNILGSGSLAGSVPVTVELSTHPSKGYDDIPGSKMKEERVNEYLHLKNPALLAGLERIGLKSFREL